MPAARANIRDLVNGSAGNGLSAKGTVTPDNKPSTTLKPPTLGVRDICSAPGIPPKGRPAPPNPWCAQPSVDATYFPQSHAERASFRTNTGKKVTPHHWAVYDYILNIPKGNVATYKSVCKGLGQGSPRSVGSALRNNPFAPHVPCHRVISSDLYLGGYCGEWGPQSKTGTQFTRKLQLLRDEGVDFDDKGMLLSKEKLM